MALLFHTSFTFLCLWIAISSASDADDDTVKVTCGAGTFIGNVKTMDIYKEKYKVNRFLGIPYAEPPVGEKRFRKPVSKSPLVEPYDATKYGASCHGLYMEMEGARKPVPIENSEDCLFLNIFTPSRDNMNEKLPVMMFIHGGGFNLGTATVYPGEVFSAVGNVIQVTINYRLNAWGFLSTGDSEAPGNYGLWDQHMAIQWIHDNIEAFGGDPERFTIFGYSAGSASVIYQSMYHGNDGLFQRVIAMSGSITSPWAFNRDPIRAVRKLGPKVGCYMHESEELVKCIKSKPEKELVTALDKDEAFIVFPMEFVTAVDGDFIKQPPKELFNEYSEKGTRERQLLAGRDFMTGITTNEGLMMITTFVGVHGTEEFTINKDEFINTEIPKIAKIMFGDDATEVVEQILLNEYYPWEDPDNDTAIREAFLRLSSDYTFGIQAVQSATVHSLQESKNTFFYVFDANPSQHMLQSPTWTDKPTHCDDLTFLFGYDTEIGYGAWTMPYTTDPPADWEVELSKAEITMWTNFARSGNPNLPNDILWYTKSTWPKFTRQGQEYFHISREMSQQPSVRKRPLAKIVKLWNATIPFVIQATKNADGQQFCQRPED